MKVEVIMVAQPEVTREVFYVSSVRVEDGSFVVRRDGLGALYYPVQNVLVLSVVH